MTALDRFSQFVTFMGRPRIYKDPDAVLDYYFRFTRWMTDGDTIEEIVSVEDDGVTVDSSEIVGSGLFVKIWVSGGGAAGTIGWARVRIRTVGGRIDDRTVYFKIREH